MTSASVPDIECVADAQRLLDMARARGGLTDRFSASRCATGPYERL